MPLEIITIPCLQDNYAFLAHDPVSGDTALVDIPEAAPVLAALKQRNWTLTHILITHHHDDHVQGLGEVLAAHPDAKVIGASADAHRLPDLDIAVAEGDTVRIGDTHRACDRRVRPYSRAYRLSFSRQRGSIHRRQPDGTGLRAAV